MYLRYSSSVVAPTKCNSPRANIGLSRLPASIEPSPLPAPTTLCNSSMKSRIRPSDSCTSLSTALRRSSNSPRNLAPAMSAPISSAIIRLSFKPSGTSRRTMRCASPSTTAVFPTPGSPISTGLFLVRRESTWITRRISSSRPITGSSLPCSAIWVRSRPKRSSGLWSSSWPPCAAELAASGAICAPPLGARSQWRSHVGHAHELTAAVGDHELGAEGAAQLLQLLGQAYLGAQRFQLEGIDTGVHAPDLALEVE